MELLLVHLNRHLGKNNSIQIILAAVAIHSFISIVMIYMHLSWFFNTENSKDKLEFVEPKDGGILYINEGSNINLISNEVMKSDSISHYGWWMDHYRWNTNVQCFNKKWAICEKVFSTRCKSDRIRAIYQFIPLKNEAKLDGIEISLRATAEQLLAQSNEPFYGIIVLIKLSNGLTETLKIEFPSELDLWTKRSITYSSTPRTYLSSITVMLMCVGYSGTVSFSDIRITPLKEQSRWKSPAQLGSWCQTHHRDNIHQKLHYEMMEIPDGGVKNSNKFDITFVTQVSMDRLVILERNLQTWTGPVSLTIYVPVKDVKVGLLEWQKMYIIKKVRNLNLTSDSHVNLVIGTSDEDYPINAMRNIAINHVKTKYMFLTDADFQPSPDFEQLVASTLSTHKFADKTAFVVPAFEYLEMPKKGDISPKTKEEFLQLIHREDPLIQPFRVFESTDAHRLTDYWKWYYANSHYQISSFSDKYEPYVVIEKSNNFPYYYEGLKNYGMNKVSHTTELYAADYKFVILHNVWMIHLPHKASQYSQEFLQSAQQRISNRAERFEFIADIIGRYKIKIDGCL